MDEKFMLILNYDKNNYIIGWKVITRLVWNDQSKFNKSTKTYEANLVTITITCSIIPDNKKEKARMYGYARTHTIKHADLGLDASF